MATVDPSHPTQASVGEGAGGPGTHLVCLSSLPPSLLLRPQNCSRTDNGSKKMGAQGVREKTLCLSCILTAQLPCPTTPQLVPRPGSLRLRPPFNGPHCSGNLFLLFFHPFMPRLICFPFSGAIHLFSGPLDVFLALIPKQDAWTGPLS